MNSEEYMRVVYNMCVNSADSKSLLNSIVNISPRMKPIVEMMNSGMTSRKIFETLCKERDIDPNEYLSNIVKTYGKEK